MMSQKNPTNRRLILGGLTTLTLVLSLCPRAVTAQTNNVTGGDTINYTINNLPDPPLTLQRGVTYTFQLSGISIHPFWIKSVLGGNFSGGTGAFNTGVVNNGSTSGTLTFTVPGNAPNQLFYQCGNHAAMNGTLTIINPTTPPPTIQIVHLNIGSNLTVTSTLATTNGLTLTPEFSTNLLTTNWVALTVQSNKFLNGTNEIICGKPTANPAFLRIRALVN